MDTAFSFDSYYICDIETGKTYEEMDISFANFSVGFSFDQTLLTMRQQIYV